MKPKRDIYQEVTDKIVASLEAGTVPWRQPWKNVGGELPRNIRTGKKYRGVNVFLLAITAMLEGYGDPRWGTYKAIGEKGGQVRKGEKGTRIIFWKKIEPKDGAPEDERPYMILRDYVVFNAAQCDGIEALPHEPLPEHERNERCEEIINGYVSPNVRKIRKGEFKAGPRPIREAGNSAFYQPKKDSITLPPLGQFEDADAFYSTAFHELVHSTGHESRLARIEPATFGTDPYAKEELVAELGAAMLNAVTGIETRDDESASYIDHWLGRLKGDPKLVVQAAAQAQKAADMIVGETFEDEKKEAGSAKADLALSA